MCYNLPMELLIAILLVVLVALVGLVAFLLLRPQGKSEDIQSLVLLQNQIDALQRGIEQSLRDGSRQTFDINKQMFDNMKTQFDSSQKLATDIRDLVHTQLREVAKGVAETNASTKQVFTIAEQLNNLEKVLKNQKQRGNLGEASLELVLSNVLPPGQYRSQYGFADGEKVDVAIITPDGVIPVDAKFPLENYVRFIDETDEVRRENYRKDFKLDVKRRIDECAKYIRPEEGTMPFAFMFIPAEGIYYDLLNNDIGTGVNSRDLIEYAYKEKHVIIASPTTFLAYLQTVLFGTQRMKVQEAAKDIIKNVSELSKHLSGYQEHHNKLGKALSQAVGHFESSSKAFRQVDKDVVKITDERIGLSLESVDRPGLANDE